MASPFKSWTVLPHEAIREVSDRVWLVRGDVPGMQLKRWMTVVRLTGGRVLVHNPVALEAELMAKIEAWGRPAFIAVPGVFHRLDARVYADRYPQARVVCPRGALKKVREVVDGPAPYDGIALDDAAVSLTHLDGVGEGEGVLKVVDDGGATLVFNDVLFNMAHQPGLGGLLLRLLGSTGGPRVTRIGRFFAVKDAERLRQSLLQLSDTPNLARIVPGHGDVITERCRDTLRDVAAAL